MSSSADHADSKAAFKAGVVECLQLIPSYVPFGLVCGVASVQAGLGEWGGGSGCVCVRRFVAGGAHAVSVGRRSVDDRDCLGARGESANGGLQCGDFAAHRGRVAQGAHAVGGVSVDQTFISNEARHQRGEHMEHPLAFYLGCAMMLWPWWVLMNAIGAFAGAKLPSSWQLDFTIPLSFVAMVVPLLKTRSQILAAIAGGVAGVLLYAMPLKTGLIAACVFGTCVGMFVDAMLAKRASSEGAAR